MYRYYLNVLIFFIIKINEYRSMLWSLWMIYILFAEKFEAKISTNIFRFKNIDFLHGLSSVKIVPISDIEIIRKGTHLKFAMGATLHRYATSP